MGIDESCALVEKACEEVGGCDLLLGHSQGAMLASVLLARAATLQSHMHPQASILSGAAVPAPASSLLEAAGKTNFFKQSCLSLHCIGARDDINPPPLARKLATYQQAHIYEHGGGHIMPMGEEALRTYTRFLGDACLARARPPE